MDTVDALKLLTEAGMGALVIWLVLHIFRVFIPKIVDVFIDEARTARREFAEELRALSVMHRTEHQAERELICKAITRNTEVMEELTRTITGTYESLPCQQVRRGIEGEGQ